MQEKRLFARKASGLVRSITWFDALALGLACTSNGMARLFYLSYTASWAGADPQLWVFLGAAFSVGYVWLASMIGGSMPRSGGDYVLTSRVLGPHIGFMSNFLLIMGAAFVIGGMCPLMNGVAISGFFWSLGIIFRKPEWVAFASEVTGPTWILIAGTIAILVTAIIMILPTRFSLRYFTNIMIILAVGTSILLVPISYSVSPQQFAALWDAKVASLGGLTYDQVILAAKDAGLQIRYDLWFSLTMGGSLLSFWMYHGSQIAAYYAGEFKEAAQKIPIANMGALWITWIIHAIAIAAQVHLVGYEWMASAGWMFMYAPQQWGLGFPSLDFMTTLIFPNPIYAIVIWIASMGWAITLFLSFMFFCSRCMFAWAFDRIVPEKVAYVSPRWKTPVVSVIIITVIAEIGLVFSTYFAGIATQLNYNLIICTAWIISGAAGIVYPYKKKEIFEASPKWVKWRIAGVPFFSIWSLITMVIFSLMYYYQLAWPAVGGMITWKTLATIYGVFIIGGILYFGMRWYRLKTEGVDISKAHEEIPPL